MKSLFTILLVWACMMATGQRNHLVLEATFEQPPYLSMFDSVLQCGNRMSISDSVKRSGNKSLRTDLYLSDTLLCNNLHTQLTRQSGATNHVAWYGFSFYLSDGYPNNYDGVESIIQFYSNDSYYMPPLQLNYNGLHGPSGNWPLAKYITAVVSQFDANSSGTPYVEYHYPLDTVSFNKWTDVVITCKWSNDSTGYIRIWVNGRLRYINSGANNYSANHWRVGPDKQDWRLKWNVSSTNHRCVFYDEVRMGDSLASYIDVVPGVAGSPLPIDTGKVIRPLRNPVIELTIVSPVINQKIELIIHSIKKQSLSYEVLSISGQTVQRGVVSLAKGQNTIQLPFRTASGVYVFALQTEFGIVTKKFIV